MKRIAILFAVALSLGGCAPGTKLGDAFEVVTRTIQNPIGATDAIRIELAYGAAVTLAAEYRKFCWARTYKALMADPVAKPICAKRRSVARFSSIQRKNAKAALIAAQNFVRDNPTLNAATALGAAWQAVTDFQNAIPK